MKFDIVVGNPPYNSDIYLDFVTKAYEQSSNLVCMITPAKWQAKGGKDNESFRQNIVPHMSKIVYYPDSRDVFNIKMQGGVCYYTINKDKVQDVSEIINVCNKNSLINSNETRIIKNNYILLNKGISILNNIHDINKLINVRCSEDDNFQVYMLNAYMNGAIMLNSGDTLLFAIMHTEEKNSIVIGDSEKLIFSSNNEYECESYISYMQTKFIRFIAFMLIDGQQPKLNTIYKFIPDPGAFDKIYEDKPLSGYEPNETTGEYIDSNGKTHCSLYAKYKLKPDEISIIESVIKERK